MEETKESSQVELSCHKERAELLEVKLADSLQEAQSLKSQLVVLKSNHKTLLEESLESSKQLGEVELVKNRLQQELIATQGMMNQLKSTTAHVREEKRELQGMVQRTKREVLKDVSGMQRDLVQLSHTLQRYKILMYIVYFCCVVSIHVHVSGP